MEVKSEFKKTEAGYIPVDWTANSLNDISEINKGKQLSKLDMLGGEYYVLNGGQVPSGYHNTFNTPENTISISEGGNSCGFVKFNKEKFWSGGHNYTLSLRENINILFLYHYLKYKENIIMSLRVGSGLPNIQKKALQNFYISLPPLKEQQKIAEILSTVDEQIGQTDQLIQKTKELKKGLMQQLLTKGIGHTEFKHSEIGEIPVEWEVKELKKVLEKVVGGGTPSRKNSNFYIGSIPWVTVKDMKGDLYQGTAQESINEEAVNKSSTNLISAGNVIIATRMALGRAFINTRDIAINQDLKALYLNKEVIYNPYFLYWYLSNAKMIESLGSGTTVKGIRVEQLTKIKIVIPPMEEQRKIAEILSSIDEEIDGYQKEKAKYEELKKGLMQQLLTGKKRVKV